MVTSQERRLRTAAGGYRLSDDAYNEQWKARVRARCSIDENGCWLWQGFIHRNGYANASHRAHKVSRLHRLSYLVFVGAIPDGHDVCHRCDIRHCINPEHLFTGTRQQNHDDMWTKGRAWQQQKDACRRGHPWSQYAYYVTGTNKSTGKSGRWRKCRACDRLKEKTPSYIAWRREYQRSRRAEMRAKRDALHGRAP